VIATERLQLRPFPKGNESFVLAVHTLLGDPEVMQFMNMKRSADAWDTSKYIGACAELERYNRGRAFALWDAKVGRLVGVATLAFDQPHSAVFGGYLYPSAQRHGYGVEATKAITQWCFAMPGLWRVAAQCDVRNGGAVKVLERAGFTLEGRLGRAWPGFGGEEPRDVFSYAVTR
jgi:RimJ/RimL family protein N-acetyltransferase